MAGRKIPVGVLGATGTVGQRLLLLLADHPWFEVVAVTGSARTAGKVYGDAVRWIAPGEMPPQAAALRLSTSEEELPETPLLFSALPSSVAADLEPALAERGHFVCSNASAHRMDPDVPLLIPEINPDHLALIERQRADRGWPGLLVTSPNCSTTGVVFPLHALHRAYGVLRAQIVTMQAISGAGRRGLPALEIQDNVLPHIAGEEEKVETEPNKLLGALSDEGFRPAELAISAQCHRVPVTDGHLAAISMELAGQPSLPEVASALANYEPSPASRSLPSSPPRAMVLREEVDRPQPRLDRDASAGMTISVGRLQPSKVLDFQLVSLVHNSMRGAASGALLNAELLVQEGYLNTAEAVPDRAIGTKT